MYRETRYLKKNIKKSLIISLLFTVTLTILLLTSMLQSSINEFRNSLDYTNGVEVKLQPKVTLEGADADRTGGRNASLSGGIMPSEVESILNNDIVKNVRYNLEIPGIAELDLLTFDDESDAQSQGITLIKATNNLELETEVLNGNIVSDVKELEGNQLVISDVLLEQNGLKIGDTINLSDKRNESSYPYVIVGTFKFQGEYDMNNRYLPENNMYIGFEGAELLLGSEIESYNSVSFFIKDLTDIQALEEIIFIDNGIDQDKYQVVINDQIFKSIIEPLENIYNVTKYVGYFVLAVSIFIFVIFISLMVKQRHFEIGVLLAIGESKTRIIMQFINENLIIYIISFCISMLLSTGVMIVVIKYINNIISGEEVKQLLSVIDSQVSSMSLSIDPINIAILFMIVIITITAFLSLILMKILIKQPKEIMNLN